MLLVSDLGILADDLTGACDAAAAFAARIGPVQVILDPLRGGAAAAEAKLVVLNTQSRLLSPSASRRRVAKVARALRGKAIVYKKTDSVLRGAVGAELEAMARLFPRHPVYLVPAIPEMGKTTKGGRLFERGIPAHQTEYGRDPVSPLRTNDIGTIIAASGRVSFEAPDAESPQDIARTVERAFSGGQAILAGSLGLADELARRIPPAARDGAAAAGAGSASARAGGVAARRTLILNGSRYPTACAQLSFAAAALGEEVLDARELGSDVEMLRRCRGKSVVFLQVDAGGLPGGREARRRLDALFRSVRLLVRSCPPDAVGIIGGETAFRILRLLRVTSLEVEGRDQPGLTYGFVRDGELCGCAFSAKGGSVGSADACVRMVACMARRGKDSR
jgi:D-threonate/D-erythronate kinase